MAANWDKFLPRRICHVGPTYKKTITSGDGTMVVLGEGVRLFGSDEERGENCIFIICGPHMTNLTWKKFNPRGGHMTRLTVKHD